MSKPFLDYLRADGIILPDDNDDVPARSENDSGFYSESENADNDNESDDEDEDIAAPWRNIHRAIQTTITKLGGKVVPKLNWSAPKDATWMNANTMECRTANDIYLLLKSSDFITHDLEHAFDDTVDSPDSTLMPDSIPYYLVLRKAVPQWNPSVEFRCFVRRRKLLCICQRDLNHYDFLSKMLSKLGSLIQQFFDVRLRDTFADENFAFDVYVPNPYNRVWLVDINPWAPRTDPLLFSWMELLSMPEPPEVESDEEVPEVVRLSLSSVPDHLKQALERETDDDSEEEMGPIRRNDYGSEDEDDVPWLPELRLVRKTDPEAFNFNSPQYSAHKLPKDVVQAAESGEGLAEFARNWRDVLDRRTQEDDGDGESSASG